MHQSAFKTQSAMAFPSIVGLVALDSFGQLRTWKKHGMSSKSMTEQLLICLSISKPDTCEKKESTEISPAVQLVNNPDGFRSV